MDEDASNPDDLLNDLMAEGPENEEPESRRKRLSALLDKHAKRQRL